jgi:hypothetical protein
MGGPARVRPQRMDGKVIPEIPNDRYLDARAGRAAGRGLTRITAAILKAW